MHQTFSGLRPTIASLPSSFLHVQLREFFERSRFTDSDFFGHWIFATLDIT